MLHSIPQRSTVLPPPATSTLGTHFYAQPRTTVSLQSLSRRVMPHASLGDSLTLTRIAAPISWVIPPCIVVISTLRHRASDTLPPRCRSHRLPLLPEFRVHNISPVAPEARLQPHFTPGFPPSSAPSFPSPSRALHLLPDFVSRRFSNNNHYIIHFLAAPFDKCHFAWRVPLIRRVLAPRLSIFLLE